MENPIQTQSSGDKYKLFLPISIIVAAVIISGAVLYSKMIPQKDATAPTSNNNNNNAPAQPTGPVNVSVDDDAVLGKSDAPVTIIEFSDFQCPYCRKFWKEALAQIKKEYIDAGKAKLVFRDYPLSFHPMATPSAEAAECAKEQGKFWEMHDVMFQEQEKLGTVTIKYTSDDLKEWAAKVGVNANQFNDCFDSRKYKTEVEKDAADGAAAGITGTPAIFINGRLIAGAQPFSAFKAIIDDELKKVGK